jgi:hypothetical protein
MKYSNAGDYVLVIPGTTQPLIYDRDGLNQWVVDRDVALGAY